MPTRAVCVRDPQPSLDHRGVDLDQIFTTASGASLQSVGLGCPGEERAAGQHLLELAEIVETDLRRLLLARIYPRSEAPQEAIREALARNRAKLLFDALQQVAGVTGSARFNCYGMNRREPAHRT